jgi:NTP pyrophosphatase (non-canonical NTP hydrolase)
MRSEKMNSIEQMMKITAIADNFGLERQKYKLVEEMAEAIKGIMKGDYDATSEEFADVVILIIQVTYLMKIEDKVEKHIDEKIERTISRYNINA